MRDAINAVDLAFVVDTTGSMSGLIAAAQNQMIAMLEELTRAAHVNLCLGVVEYRDHPPQDKIVYKVYHLTEKLRKAQKSIRGLIASGGGDAPEAVLDGIAAACRELAWYKYSRRLVVLVGDAPPHGMGMRGDAFSAGCPCGETIESVTRLAEEKCITIHALGLTDAVTESFSTISGMTGGKFFSSKQTDNAIETIAMLLKAEFEDVELDRRVLAAWRKKPEITTQEKGDGTQRRQAHTQYPLTC
jgi:Mg-chelatase subunit ChlD